MTGPGRRPSSSRNLNTRERMRDAVHEIVQKVADDKAANRADVVRERARKARRQRRAIWQVMGLAMILVASLIWAAPRWNHPFDPPTGPRAEHDARQTIVFAAHLVGEYAHQMGHPPVTLSDLGVSLPGLEYYRQGESWSLTSRMEGQAITFHSGDDPTEFLSIH